MAFYQMFIIFGILILLKPIIHLFINSGHIGLGGLLEACFGGILLGMGLLDWEKQKELSKNINSSKGNE